MAQPTDRLVGRAAELESLDYALAELGRRRPGALLLAGEPGIGKTRLLVELQARADANGWLVLAGSASELERELPFWVFVDALDEYVQAVEPRRLDAVDVDSRSELAHVLPSLPAGADLPPERYRAHRAMRQLLEALAQPEPMLLVLDDVHWADAGSIDLLGSLLRRPPEGVLIAIAARPRQLPERLQGPLERGRRAGTLAWLDLGPLSAGDARELLGGDAFSDALYEESRGNPFYLQQLARFPEARTVATALAEELALLPDGARRVLEGAAVAGDPFEPELAAAAAGVPDPAAIDALDELLRVDLVRPTEVPRRFRFRHPLVRSAVYETAPAGWRLGAHERAATALAARGAPPLERAHHLERCARHGDAEAVAVLRAAGEATALRAPAIAARWFGAALRLVPAGSEARLELLGALAGASASIGRFKEAHAATLEALSLAPSIERTAAAAGFEHVLGDHESARARLAAAVEELPDGASPAAAAVMLELAHSHVFTGGVRPDARPGRACPCPRAGAGRPPAGDVGRRDGGARQRLPRLGCGGRGGVCGGRRAGGRDERRGAGRPARCRGQPRGRGVLPRPAGARRCARRARARGGARDRARRSLPGRVRDHRQHPAGARRHRRGGRVLRRRRGHDAAVGQRAAAGMDAR
jgi:hypothetical protein